MKSRAFTIVELFVALAIVAVLVALLVPALSKLRARAQRLQCIGNLKSLHTAANLSLQQNGFWPQIPSAAADETASREIARRWIAELKQHGIPEKSWICPTIQNESGNPDYTSTAAVRIDYTPMAFDDKPTTPLKWPRQPWFVENGDVHGNGNLIIFTDGSISDLKTVAATIEK